MSSVKSKINHLKKECHGTFLENKLFDILAGYIDEDQFNKFYSKITVLYGIPREDSDSVFIPDGFGEN